MSETTIDICICTFRRPHIEQTLMSLARLEMLPSWRVRVLVVDNDDTPSAKALVEQTFAALPFPGTYSHAPACNISIARNVCLEQAGMGLLAFLDDDELAHPPWLKALVETHARDHAAAVLGPVNALYGSDAPAWMKQGDFHSTRPVWVDGQIRTGYSGNLLLDRSHPSLQGLRFELGLGTSGGEDTVFLGTMHARGGTIAYAEDALVDEPVSVAHAKIAWLLKRKFRSGQSHAMLHGGGVALGAKAMAKALFCAVMVGISAFSQQRRITWLLRGALHLGVAAKTLGLGNVKQHG